MPLISIVMPTYNRAASLGRAVDSVLQQEFRDFELIVVDDGSSDGTRAVMQDYAQQAVYVRLDGNRGGNFARNRGIERASGAIVSFLDSDDEFLPHKLAFVADYFAAHAEIDGLVDSFEIRYPAAANRPAVPRRNPVLDDSASLREAVFARRLYKATPAISARRQALLDIGMFDETLRRRQDMDLILRLTKAHRCASTDQILWVKHWTPGAISSKHSTFLPAIMDICQRHPDYIAVPAYRKGLDRDLGRHFWRLLRAGRVADLRADLKRYREFGRFGRSPWLLMLQYLKQRGQGLVAPR
jgi:glycosyltransferase involved in cell wall biosynthesis